MVNLDNLFLRIKELNLTAKKLSNDTLLLRIFSEVYQNKPSEPVNDIFLYKLLFFEMGKDCFLNSL